MAQAVAPDFATCLVYDFILDRYELRDLSYYYPLTFPPIREIEEPPVVYFEDIIRPVDFDPIMAMPRFDDPEEDLAEYVPSSPVNAEFAEPAYSPSTPGLTDGTASDEATAESSPAMSSSSGLPEFIEGSSTSSAADLAASPVVFDGPNVYHRCFHCEHEEDVRRINASLLPQDHLTLPLPDTFPFLPYTPPSRQHQHAEIWPCPHVDACPCDKDHVHTPYCIVECRWNGCGKMFLGREATLAHFKSHWRDHAGICKWEGCKKPFVKASSIEKHLGNYHAGYFNIQCSFCGACVRQDSHGRRHARCIEALELLEKGEPREEVTAWFERVAPRRKPVDAIAEGEGSTSDESRMRREDGGAVMGAARPTKRARAEEEDSRQSKRSRVDGEQPLPKSNRNIVKRRGAAASVAGSSSTAAVAKTRRR